MNISLFIFLIPMLAIVEYVFSSLGLYRILSSTGFNEPWFAFVPFLRTYAEGYLADMYHYSRDEDSNYACKFLLIKLLSVSAWKLTAGFVIGAIVSFELVGEATNNGIFGFYLFALCIMAYAIIVFGIFKFIFYVKVYKRIFMLFMPRLWVLFFLLTMFAWPAGAVILFVISRRQPLLEEHELI